MADVENQAGGGPAGRTGTGWLLVALQRGVVLSLLYGLLWIAVGAVANWVTGSETGVVGFGVLVVVFGVPIGAAAGLLVAAVCAAVDRAVARHLGRHLSRRTVAVRVLCAIGVVSALLAAAAIDFWAVFVGAPCALGLASLWLWPLPPRPTSAPVDASER